MCIGTGVEGQASSCVVFLVDVCAADWILSNRRLNGKDVTGREGEASMDGYLIATAYRC
jgi:hypothetical protein